MQKNEGGGEGGVGTTELKSFYGTINQVVEIEQLPSDEYIFCTMCIIREKRVGVFPNASIVEGGY